MDHDDLYQAAFSAGRFYALHNLLTVEQAAQEIGVSRRRMAAIVRTRHQRLGIGVRVGRTWLICRDELESLRPGPVGRPRGWRKNKKGEQN